MENKKNEIPTMTGQEAFNELVVHLMGEDYYIVDPIPNCQANVVILKEIKSKYMSMDKKLRIHKIIVRILISLGCSIIGYILGHIVGGLLYNG